MARTARTLRALGPVALVAGAGLFGLWQGSTVDAAAEVPTISVDVAGLQNGSVSLVRDAGGFRAVSQRHDFEVTTFRPLAADCAVPSGPSGQPAR